MEIVEVECEGKQSGHLGVYSGEVEGGTSHIVLI